MDDCVFCKIIEGKLPAHTIYEDERFKVFFDRYPSSLGHTLIVPKAHAADIYELDDAHAAGLFPLIKKTAKALTVALGCDGMNVLQNNGAAAGQSVRHFHVHLIPRYDGDGVTIAWQNADPDLADFNDLQRRVRV